MPLDWAAFGIVQVWRPDERSCMLKADGSFCGVSKAITAGFHFEEVGERASCNLRAEWRTGVAGGFMAD